MIATPAVATAAAVHVREALSSSACASGCASGAAGQPAPRRWRQAEPTDAGVGARPASAAALVGAACLALRSGTRRSARRPTPIRPEPAGRARGSVARRAFTEPSPSIDLPADAVRMVPPIATYGSDEPERTRSSQVIQHRLMSEPQYQAVLELFGRYRSKFDVINRVCALHLCALTARDHEHLQRQIQVDPNFVLLFNDAKQEVLKDVKAVSPRTASDLLWSCARLNIFDSDLFNVIISDATERMELFTTHGISLLVFALGYVGQRPRAAFMQALVRELRARIDTEFDPQTLGMVVYGMMRLGIKDDRLMRIVSEHLVRTGFEGMDNLTLVCHAYAYSKLEYWDENVFADMGRRIVDRISTMEPRQICMASLCFSQSAGILEESDKVMSSIIRKAQDMLDKFSNRDLSTYAFAVGKHMQLTTDESLTKGARFAFGQDDTNAEKIISQVERRGFETFDLTEMNLITYSLMRLKYRDDDFLEKAAKQFTENAPELQSIEIVNVLYAFARLEYVDIRFVSAMIEEIKRRKLLREGMTTLEIATLAYSLAMSRILDEEIFDEIAMIVCERVRSFSPQCISMLLWSMAVVNPRTHAEAVVSACMEDMAGRLELFEPQSVGIALWSSAILSGSGATLWILQILFKDTFWLQQFDASSYAMMYHLFTALRVEENLEMENMQGWFMSRRVYEEVTGSSMSQQNQRLSERLRMQRIPHVANGMPPSLEGCQEAGMRADIVIEKLKLIIEVEGPQRMTIPLQKVLEEMGDSNFKGKPVDVIEEVRGEEYNIECPLTGSATFKRRLLRKCGWRVVTVSFDENEEYIADALTKMALQDSGGSAEASEEAEDEPQMAEEAVAETMAPDMGDFGQPNLTFQGDELQEQQKDLSPFEQELRNQHAKALKELQRRVASERGDAAASAAYSTNLEYRKWQVNLEKEVLRDLVAQLQKEKVASS